ncbi:MAG: putative RND superfamily exporter protein [Hyphomicrobiaceae bacterium]|jgi:predicted RND superfamily exporter protein
MGAGLISLIVCVTAGAIVATWAAWRHPRVVIERAVFSLGVPVLISGLAVFALVDPFTPTIRMSLDSSEAPMLPDGDPAQEVYQDAIRNFGDDDVFVVVLATNDVFTADTLEALTRIDRALRRLPGIRGTESLVQTTHVSYNPSQDMVEVGDLIEEIPQTEAELLALKATALSDPLHLGTVVGEGGWAAAINVSFLAMSDEEYVESGLDASIADILAAEQTHSRRFFVTGRKHIKAAAHRRMVSDLLHLIPLAVLVGATIGGVVTGSLRAAVFPVGASLIATLWAFGALAALGRPLNLISLVLGPTLICVGSVFGVHVLARFEEEARNWVGSDSSDAAERRRASFAAATAALAYVRLPLAIAAVTTCIGFGALVISPTPAIRELGLFSALGIAAVASLSLSALPAQLARLGPQGHSSRGVRGVEKVLAWLADVVLARPTAVLCGWAVALVLAVVSIFGIVVDTDYLSFFDHRATVRTDFATIGALVSGAMPIYLTLDGHDEGFFRDPANLRALERLQRRVDELDGVDKTLSLVDFVKPLNAALEGGDAAAARIPDSRGELAEVIFLLPKDALRTYANSNHSAVNLLVRTSWTGSARIRALESSLYAAASEIGFDPKVVVAVTGNTIVLNHAADSIAGNQFATVGSAALAIFVLMSRVFGSLRVGALAMIPNLAPVLLFFGVLGAGVATLSLPTSLIGCIALGIAIDDTAHFLVGYRARREGGLDPKAAARSCMIELGRPIVVTSLMLVGGFSVLGVSGFATLREFGGLSALTMLLCLAADMVLLPALLVRARV